MSIEDLNVKLDTDNPLASIVIPVYNGGNCIKHNNK